MQTYDTYIPGPYENFAEQATEDAGQLGALFPPGNLQNCYRPSL